MTLAPLFRIPPARQLSQLSPEQFDAWLTARAHAQQRALARWQEHEARAERAAVLASRPCHRFAIARDHRPVLSPEEVRAIRLSTASNGTLAAAFGVSRSTIQNARVGYLAYGRPPYV